MEIFNNREIAIGFWLIFFSIYVFTSKRMTSLKESILKIFSMFFKKKISSVLFLMLFYIGAILIFLYKINLWNISQIKDTIYWVVSVGFMSFLKLETIKKDRKFLINSVIDYLKLLAILQFIVGMYTFSVWLEIALVPILVVIGGVAAVASSKEEYEPVKKITDFLLTSYGTAVIIYTSYNVVIDFNNIFQTKTFYDFAIPPILTFMYLPFIFVVMVYSVYEEASIRIQVSIKNRLLKTLAILYALIVFNIRLKYFERWISHILRKDIQTHDELIKSFKHIFKLRKAEKHPIDVPIEQGWSPYKANKFLLKEGIKTGFYNILSDEWFASSNMVKISENIISDYVEYHIEGTEHCVKHLKIILSVNDLNTSAIAHNKFLALSNVLCKASLKEELTDSIKSALLKGEELVEQHDNKKISIKKIIWPGHRFNGYDLKFTISCI